MHGEITMNIALEGNILSAELDSPAIHVVGFERAAQTEAERARLTAANTWLTSGRNFLGVPRAAVCGPVNQNYVPPAEDAKHANYRAVHEYQCDNAEALAWIELWALRKLEGVEKVTLNLIINGRQEQVVLDGKTERVTLR
ncbi:MAG: ZrgA family zinc uptake protein [Steroidobacteraceae bacterium]